MTDRFPEEVRSRIMSSVKGRNTSPELALRKALSASGLRYRKNYRVGKKTIDIAFVGIKVAIFVDGCFWHRCAKHWRMPKSNVRYWSKKIRDNVLRDRATNSELESKGWRVIRIWEHEVKQNPYKVASRIKGHVKRLQAYNHIGRGLRRSVLQ